LIGEIGKTVTKLSPSGEITVHGEFWKAECLEGDIEEGVDVEVVVAQNLKLKVKKVSE